ncbi:MAG: dihydrofolate reductase family protein [Mycobacteriales bacterium]
MDAPGPAGLDELYAHPAPHDGSAWVRANMIVSVDGRTTVEGRSGGLGGDADRELLGLLRSLSDVILVGSATVRAEGYRPAKLRTERRAARVAAGRPPYPAIAVVSARLDLDLDADLYADPSTIVVTSENSDPTRLSAVREGCQVLTTPGPSVDLAGAARTLAGLGRPRVLCEGGPRLLASLVAAAALDELCLSVSPSLAGGDGPGLLAGLPPTVRALRLASSREIAGMLFLRYLTGAREV